MERGAFTRDSAPAYQDFMLFPSSPGNHLQSQCRESRLGILQTEKLPPTFPTFQFSSFRVHKPGEFVKQEIELSTEIESTTLCPSRLMTAGDRDTRSKESSNAIIPDLQTPSFLIAEKDAPLSNILRTAFSHDVYSDKFSFAEFQGLVKPQVPKELPRKEKKGKISQKVKALKYSDSCTDLVSSLVVLRKSNSALNADFRQSALTLKKGLGRGYRLHRDTPKSLDA